MLVLVMDGQAGFTPADQDIVAWLRRKHAHKPWLLCINKCENAAKAEMQVRVSSRESGLNALHRSAIACSTACSTGAEQSQAAV